MRYFRRTHRKYDPGFRAGGTAALLLLLLMLAFLHCGNDGSVDTTVDTVLETIGVTRGIVAVLGEGASRLAADLANRSDLKLYVQIRDTEDVDAARRSLDESGGLNGTRVWVGEGALSHIHLADNVADAVVVTDDTGAVPESEILRIMHPNAKALVGGREIVKPFPEGIDDWSHPYHGPDNNPQSEDTIARAPYLTQFLAAPYYAPLPQMTVASAGRVFRSLGHIAFKPREERYANTLMAYNGYNGTVLWTREITPGIMVHRNTMIATPEVLYVGDDTSCKVFDAATGELVDEIAPPVEVAGGTFWKWMAIEDGVLYALVGEDEMRDPQVRRSWADHGWPWNPLSKGYNLPENPWGYGSTVLAIDPGTKKVLWIHREDEPIDSRSMCMKNGRLFAFRFGSYITALDAATGKVAWKRTVQEYPNLFAAIGSNLNRQDWRTNWRTVSYMKCSDDAIYFAGPMFDKLIVLSTENGDIMWTHPYDNFQLVLRDDGLYGISGPWADPVSKRFEPQTGKILGEFAIGRRACTRPTGSADAVFFRANGGSVRFDVATQRQQYVSPMRPSCFDGVTVANGLLYWWPSVCDCQLSLYGALCLGPAGSHDFYSEATSAERLETGDISPENVKHFPVSPADWPTFRANTERTALSPSEIPSKAQLLWQCSLSDGITPTAPVAAGGCVFVGGSNGVVLALDAASGSEKWTSFTGGSVRVAPTVWNNRIFTGSGDGWVYALEAATGRRLWRFRAAPKERVIPVYGSLSSTWPAASGVAVGNGVAYVAAGIANYDGTYVYALDAETGDIRWQNTTSGHLNREARTGIGVQGHLLLHGGKLYMAGGNAVSPGVYDIADGKCLNNGDRLNICESIALRGWELYLVGDKVAVGGQPFYRDPEFPVVDRTVMEKAYHVSTGERDILWMDGARIACYRPIDRKLLNASVYDREYPGHYIINPWGRLDVTNKPLWELGCEKSLGVAVCGNAVIVLCEDYIYALNIENGSLLWKHALAVPPVPWGLAVDQDGRVIVSLENGTVVCYGQNAG